MAAAEVKSIQEQKRELIERNQRYREAIVADCAHVGASLWWVPRTIQVVRSISPLLLVASPLLGWLARKKLRNGKLRSPDVPGEKKKKAGFFAAAWKGFRLYQQIAPFVQGFMKAWPAAREKHSGTYATQQGSTAPRIHSK